MSKSSSGNKRKEVDSETDLSGHTRNGKELRPPLLKMELEYSSWVNDRLPDMLWAALVVGEMNRDDAIEFFKYVSYFTDKYPEAFDVTHTGISKLNQNRRSEFIQYLGDYSDEIRIVLRPLLLFSFLPAYDDWKQVLGAPVPEEDLQKLANGIGKTFNHQSQEATDCRWIKIYCQVIAGKINFFSNMEDLAKLILGYPHYGDQAHARSSIRALEISQVFRDQDDRNWCNNFWKECYDRTGCIPEQGIESKIKERHKELVQNMELVRKSYFDQTVTIRQALIDHCFSSSETSIIDSRHEASFGFALYAFTLFTEIILYNSSLSITGRLGLRSLVETYLTFAYCLHKEKEVPGIWSDYRSYGTGQSKLIYLKLKGMGNVPNSISLDYIRHIANEDKWIEFTPINLGHWDSTDLRKMSDDAGFKDIYDKYYAYTSSYMHASWGAIRESIYQNCLNPLHRYHRIPTYDLPLMPSVTIDALKIMNDILGCLSDAYPSFDLRFREPTEEELVKEAPN